MKKTILTQLLILFFCFNIYAQDKASKIDSLLNKYYSQGELNGAVLVVHKGEVIYKNAFGTANSNWDIKNSVDSKFNLFSVTKQFTAILILQLVEEGKIDLHKSITDYLPYYRSDIGKKITIHHLLLHSHGIPDIDYKKLPMQIDLNTEEFITKYASGDLEFEPGSKYEYSAITGYTILTAIIEKVTNKTYEQVLSEKILRPLNITNSGFIHFDKSISKMTTSYLKDINTIRLHFFMHDCNGASSIYSTVEDLYLYSKGLEENKLLSPEIQLLLFTPYIPFNNPNHSYGGNYVKFTLNEKEVEMVGISGGGRNTIAMSLNDDFFIAILNNMQCPKTDEIFFEILKILYK